MMNNEIKTRALNTEKDFQNAYDDLKEEREVYEKKIKYIKSNMKSLIDNVAETEKVRLERMIDGYNDKIEKIESKMKDLLSKADKKEFEIKRSEETDFEVRALETEKDYQKEIDSLEQKREKCMDTVEKLRVDWMKLEDEYDKKVEQIKKEQNSLRTKAAEYVSQIRKLKAEAKQKGFNIRSKDYYAFELRGLKTQDDYQKEYNKVKQKLINVEADIKEATSNMKKYSNDIIKLEKFKSELEDELEELAFDARENGFKIKTRSEDVVFEARSIQNPTNEKECQRAISLTKESIDSWTETIKDTTQRIKDLKEDIAYYTDEVKDAEAQLNKEKKRLSSLYSFADANKWKVRSEESDFEARKKEVVGDLTGLNERKQEVLDSLEERRQGKLNSYEACKKSYESNKKYLEKYKEEIEMFNEQIDIRKTKIKELEKYMEEADSVAKSKFGKSVK